MINKPLFKKSKKERRHRLAKLEAKRRASQQI
jgi:hypothetical protein